MQIAMHHNDQAGMVRAWLGRGFRLHEAIRRACVCLELDDEGNSTGVTEDTIRAAFLQSIETEES